MSKNPLAFLDLLEKRVLPNKQEEVRIELGYSDKKHAVSEPKEYASTTEGKQKGKRKQAFVLDKRSESVIDRDATLARLRERNVFIVKPLISVKMSEIVEASIQGASDDVDVVAESKRQGSALETASPHDHATPSVIEEKVPVVAKKNKRLVLKKTVPPIIEDDAAGAEEEGPGETKAEDIEVVLVEEEKPGPKKRAKKLKIVESTESTGPVDLTTVMIRSQTIADRLPREREKIIVRAPTYYMNNRKLYVQKLIELFAPYRQELIAANQNVTCESRGESAEFDLLTHQKVVRDYLNLYTPYRGLLLYHNLGTGKTCSSIAMAEGMKSDKRVFVLTPASLKMNFFSELKSCGDEMYKKKQFWEFVSIEGKPEYIAVLAKALSLTPEQVRKQGGAWLVNIKQKKANFTTLTTEQQDQLDEQLNHMIRAKYTDINYNGLNMRKLNQLTADGSENPFHHSVIIIDEGHNFVSRIVNKIKKPDSISYRLYEYIRQATDVRVIILSGTPIINYPNEIGILFNLLRGDINTWTMTVNPTTSEKVTTDTIVEMLDKEGLKVFDYLEYSGNKLTITRNPFGFINVKKRGATKGATRKMAGGRGKGSGHGTKKTTTKNAATKKEEFAEKLSFKEEIIESDAVIRSGIAQQPFIGGSAAAKQTGGAPGDAFLKYDGVKLDDAGNISDKTFISMLLRILRKYNMEIPDGSIELRRYKALPDNSDEFMSAFIDVDAGVVKNINLLQKRILGLTSYYRSSQEQLFPSFVQTAEGDNYHVVKTEMSDHQFSLYEKIRKSEADREKTAKKLKRKKAGDELFTISSTYRIFSRAACNFVFPSGIDRPIPTGKGDKEVDESDLDAVPSKLRQENDSYANIEDAEEADSEEDKTYGGRIRKALVDVDAVDEESGESVYLSLSALEPLSPKFVKVVENLQDEENQGLHLIYSHFRTIEGIGILRLILLANGFAEFKLEKVDDDWKIKEETAEDIAKPHFVLYTGTEEEEEKEIIRNAYNSAWDLVPAAIATALRSRSENNHLGEIIKIFMITSSGAEGINLKNTRFVHIIEPYWHMVRVEQVIGRARRICSHQDLPEELRNVKVFLYITTFTEEQRTSEKNIELRIRDVSRVDGKTPVTTDETLYDIASLKQNINNQILRAVKETAMDCNLYSPMSNENLVCYGYGKVTSNQFGSFPSFDRDRDTPPELDVRVMKWTARIITDKASGKEYALNEGTLELYDLASYERATKKGTEPILVGNLVKRGRGYGVKLL